MSTHLETEVTMLFILFITGSAEESVPPPAGRVAWESGPSDAVGRRLIAATGRGQDVHLFRRPRPGAPFTYLGRARIASHAVRDDHGARLEFALL